MELTRERALELHRKMWTNMQRDLGNDPSVLQREKYKRQFCEKYFPKQNIRDNCFLCEYVETIAPNFIDCKYCPIKWDYNYCFEGGGMKKSYRNIPISELLALPERN